MKILGLRCCFRATKLLLCLLVLVFLSCSSLKNTAGNASGIPQRVLQVAVNERDFEEFNQKIQALGIVAVDFVPVRTDMLGDDKEYYVMFRFNGQRSFASSCSAVMSTGVVRRINYPYQE